MYGGGVPGGDRRAEILWRTTITPGRSDMGSAIPKAKTLVECSRENRALHPRGKGAARGSEVAATRKDISE